MIYLDHAATTPVFPEVLDAVTDYLHGSYGNPSSVHSAGARARRALDAARAEVAALINADPDEIFFTSGGTESNRMLTRLDGCSLVTTELEHASVPGERLIKSDDLGSVPHSLDSILVWKRPDIVSIHWMNNETGVLQPMQRIVDACKFSRTLVHSDAVAAVGHTPVDVRDSGVDMLSLSGHKFGAPMGVGAFYLSKTTPELTYEALLTDGSQEYGLRPGTENMPGIVGMGVAARIVRENLDKWMDHWYYAAKFFKDSLLTYMPPTQEFWYNGDNPYSPIISLTLPGHHAEAMVLALDARGVAVSAGAACSSGSSKPSHVLTAMGLNQDDAASTIRISMGVNTTMDELRIAAIAIAGIIRKEEPYEHQREHHR